MAWLPGWDKRIEIKIEDYAGDIGAEVTWFPITVFLTNSKCEEVFVELTTDAEYLKVAFTKADGTTELYAEKELFDVSEELGIFHVSRDGWTINDDTSIFLYYDADHGDNTTYIGATNTAAAEAVWDSNFEAVYHMADGADNQHIYDSTDHNNDGTKVGANEPIEATGKIGQGQYFDGTNDYINLGTGIDWGAANFTLEAVYKSTVQNAEADRILGCYVGNANIADMVIDGAKHLDGEIRDVDKDFIRPLGSVDVEDSAFHHLVVVRDGDTGYTYVDGVEDGTDTTANVGDVVGANPYLIGALTDDPTGLPNCTIDEVRMSATNRSVAWLKGTKNTLWDTLLTYGSEERGANAIFFGMNF